MLIVEGSQVPANCGETFSIEGQLKNGNGTSAVLFDACPCGETCPTQDPHSVTLSGGGEVGWLGPCLTVEGTKAGCPTSWVTIESYGPPCGLTLASFSYEGDLAGLPTLALDHPELSVAVVDVLTCSAEDEADAQHRLSVEADFSSDAVDGEGMVEVSCDGEFGTHVVEVTTNRIDTPQGGEPMATLIFRTKTENPWAP